MRVESDAEILIKEALALLESGEPESAAWRLADALSLISLACDKGTAGIDKPTGRGAMIKVVA